MTSSVVSLGLNGVAEEVRLAEALDVFTRWRIDIEPENTPDLDTPPIIVKTSWDEEGRVLKTLIFDDAKWAELFLKIWRRESLT